MGNNETIKIQLNRKATAMGFPPLGRYYRWFPLPFVTVTAAAFGNGVEVKPGVLLPFIFYVFAVYVLA